MDATLAAETVFRDVLVIVAREWAILCRVNGGAVWVPRDAVLNGDLRRAGDKGTLVVSSQFARSHRLLSSSGG
jgi:hypothetical protein